MEALCFGVLVKVFREFTTLPQQETVALLLDFVTEKGRVLDKNGNPYYVDAKVASHLVNRKKNLHKNIVAASKEPIVIDSLESFVDKHVSKQIKANSTEKLIKSLKELVGNDPEIPQNLKDDILDHASVEQFSYFFSRILLYTLQVDNVPSEIPNSSSTVTEENDEQGDTDKLIIEAAGSPSLITDPKNEKFRGYLGKYYAYFTPTHSNHSDVLKGTLTFEDAETKVRALFEIDTGIRSDSQIPYLKVYEGELILSTSVNNCYCVLSSPQVGEMGFIAFRFESIFFGHRSCFLATAMTSSAGSEDRNPVVHRIFLSREIIKEEHLPGLVPFLSLNNNDILISKQDWDSIADSNSAYSEIMKSMLKNEKYKSDLYYCIRESTISDFFKFAEQDYGIQIASFISALRAKGVSDRYNKVSKKAENTLRSYLKDNGYYTHSR